jgi:DNA polymerase (family 10)
LKGHAGIGPGTEQKILAALAQPKAAEGPKRALLGTTLPKLRAVVDVLREHPASVEVELAGSARRMRETVRDLDIIATATDPQALVDDFCALRWVVEVAAKGPTKATVVSHDGLRFDLRVVPPESYGNLLQHFTGSKNHNVALREDAVRRGLSVSEYSVTVVETGEERRFATEHEVYRFLGYDWIPPELREDGGELAAARRGDGVGTFPCSSRPATSEATCTHTRRGRTARTRSRTWSQRRSAAAMPTTPSAITLSGCAAISCSGNPRRSIR